MGLPRTFVGFSSTDIHNYRLMQAWKANTKIDFNFADLQLNQAINSNDEKYIKGLIGKKITMAGKYALLIGEDTRRKHKYVRWEAEVAIENIFANFPLALPLVREPRGARRSSWVSNRARCRILSCWATLLRL